MSNDLKTLVGRVRYNPAAIQTEVLTKTLEAMEGDVTFSDPTSPFMLLMESACTTAAVSMQNSETIASALYPDLARSQEDLYRHMSDEDYLGRFAYPSASTFTLMLDKAEVMNKAVEDPEAGIRKLVIPRDTNFVVGGLTFGLHYPIEIRILPHGGLQVVYNGNTPSPLAVLEDNNVEWTTNVIEGVEFITLQLPLLQFTLTPSYSILSPASGLIFKYAFSDEFYYARVYTGSEELGWTEIHTTHSEQVYDHTKPTASLQLLDGSLRVEIPQIYVTTNLMGPQIRTDIYTTKGEISQILSEYRIEEYGVNWISHDPLKDAVYTAPLSTLATLVIFSNDVTTGGRSSLSFDVLRQQILDAGNNRPVPITDENLRVALSNLGYTIMKRLDGITDRAYQVTRELPVPDSGLVSASIGTLTDTITLQSDKIATLETVRDNGDRMTIEPSTMYELDQGRLVLVSDSDRNALRALTADRLVKALNDREFLYTPFHYVIDFNEDALEVRPYFLDSPSVVSKRHISENVNVPIQTSSNNIQIERHELGYRLVVQVPKANILDNIAIEQLHVQIGVRPAEENIQGYINGNYLGDLDDTFVYEFFLETNFDVDEEDRLMFTNIRLYESDTQEYAVDLESEFSIYYALASYPILQSKRSTIDRRMGNKLLPRGAVGNMEEACTLSFGKALNGLRNDSRSVVSSIEFERYETNIADTYDMDVYDRDEQGLIRFTIDEDTGEVTYLIKHAAGDPKLDDQGQPILKHRIGDVKLDANNEPVIKAQRKLSRQFAITLFDARYLFTEENSIVTYRDSLPHVIVSYLENDVGEVAKTLLERTELKFAPRRTIGYIDVTEKNRKVISIPSTQSFVVKYYMSDTGYRDLALRSAINDSTNETIKGILEQNTVTVNDIRDSLKTMAGEEVKAVYVSGLGEQGNLDIFTVIDQSAVASLATRLEVSTDGIIRLMDDVTIEFIKHST